MLTRVEHNLHQLSSAERRVADWILANPHMAVDQPVAGLAAAIGVSEPTVIRFCRSMGCKGFRDFKVRLAQYLAAGEQVVHADVAPDDDASAIIAKVLGRSINELSMVRARLSAARIEAAATALHEASRIEFYGMGASGIVAADAHNKFFRLGVPCVTYQDSPSIRQAAAIAGPGHAIIVVSASGESSTVLEAARAAKAGGATVIAITSPLSSLAGVASIPLLVDSAEDTGIYTPMSSRLAALAVLDVLQVAFAMRLGSEGASRLILTKAALRL